MKWWQTGYSKVHQASREINKSFSYTVHLPFKLIYCMSFWRAYFSSRNSIWSLECPTLQGYFRGAKAALALGLLPEAFELANQGLQIEPQNIELTKLGEKAKKLHDEEDAKKMRAAKAVKEAEVSWTNDHDILLQINMHTGYSVIFVYFFKRWSFSNFL